jgi:hypothetical protein
VGLILLQAALGLGCRSQSFWPEPPEASSAPVGEPAPYVPAVVSGESKFAPEIKAARPIPQPPFAPEGKTVKPGAAAAEKGPWTVRLKKVATGTEMAGLTAGPGEQFVAVTFALKNSGEENVALASHRVRVLPPTETGWGGRPGAVYSALARAVVLRLTDNAGRKTFPLVTVVKNALTDVGQFRGGTAFEEPAKDGTEAVLYVGASGTGGVWISRICYRTRAQAAPGEVALDWTFAANPDFNLAGSRTEEAASQEADGKAGGESRYAFKAELIRKDEIDDTWVFRVPRGVAQLQLRLGEVQAAAVRLPAD